MGGKDISTDNLLPCGTGYKAAKLIKSVGTGALKETMSQEEYVFYIIYSKMLL